MLSTMVAVLPISSPANLRRCIYIINCKVAFLPVSALTNLRILYIYIYTIFHMQKCDQQKCEILTFAGLTLAGSPYIYVYIQHMHYIKLYGNPNEYLTISL